MREEEQKLFEQLYYSCNGTLKAFMKKYFPGIPLEDQEEILQDVWVKLGEHLGELEKENQRLVLSWLFTVARNTSIDWIRKNVRRYELECGLEDYMEVLRTNRYLPEAVVDKIMAEEILRQLSKEEKIFLTDEFGSRATGTKQKNAVACKRYRFRKKLEEKLSEI